MATRARRHPRPTWAVLALLSVRAHGGAGRDDLPSPAFGPAGVACSLTRAASGGHCIRAGVGQPAFGGRKVGDLSGAMGAESPGWWGSRRPWWSGWRSPSTRLCARALRPSSARRWLALALSLLTVNVAGTKDWARAFETLTLRRRGAGAPGLLLGGVLTQVLSWRWRLYVIGVRPAHAIAAVVYWSTTATRTGPASTLPGY